MNALRIVAAILLLVVYAGPGRAQQPCCAANGGVTSTCSTQGFIVCQDGSDSACVCGSGVGTPPSTLGQLLMPGNTSFGNITVGATTTPTQIKVSNVGGLSVAVSLVKSGAPNEFIVVGHSCATVAPGGSCTISVAFKPLVLGPRSTSIGIVSNGVGSPQALVVLGYGAPAGAPPPGPETATIEVVEYFHSAWGHYFVTSGIEEMAKLDNGTLAGWTRTGLAFKAYPNGTAGTASMCRFFSVAFDPKSSHFYTPVASECTVVKGNPSWSFEGEVFGVLLPGANGSCPAGTLALYRLYNNGEGGAPNHRYTTDFAVRTLMLAFGWLAEGYGTDGVIACVPG